MCILDQVLIQPLGRRLQIRRIAKSCKTSNHFRRSLRACCFIMFEDAPVKEIPARWSSSCVHGRIGPSIMSAPRPHGVRSPFGFVSKKHSQNAVIGRSPVFLILTWMLDFIGTAAMFSSLAERKSDAPSWAVAAEHTSRRRKATPEPAVRKHVRHKDTRNRYGKADHLREICLSPRSPTRIHR